MPIHLTPTPDHSALSRPKIRLEAVKLRIGQSLELSDDETLVVVGPNNSGKSLLLREIFAMLINGPTAMTWQLVQDLDIHTNCDAASAAKWAEEITGPTDLGAPDPQLVMPFGKIARSALFDSWRSGLDGSGFHQMANLFATYLGTDSRLNLAQPVGALNFVVEPPTHPIHHLHEDDEIEARISAMVRRAFGQELIVNRAAGSQIPIHLANVRPQPPAGKDRFSKEYRQAVHAIPQVQQQGDGVKAFVGLLLNTLVLKYDITLVDEPEAFLHPPQAKFLGSILASERPHPSQMIVATHSSDFLKGLLDGEASSIRVIRIHRKNGKSSISELQPELVKEVWRDPLLRYSGIFDGLFHEGVIVCESDSDCRFYGAMMDAVSGSSKSHDLLLVHGGGKARTPSIVRALTAIRVPVKAVFDFDVLSDELILERSVEALGSSWNEFKGDWNTVRASIEGKRPELATKDVQEKVMNALSKVKSASLPRDTSKHDRPESGRLEAGACGTPLDYGPDRERAVYPRTAPSNQNK
ncbi:AAA family ATPase [Bradyrhizobium sp. 62B]|uniref:ATP-dependent nuclease n=1 Tax=Bradyrhizobium sp. 62B TaxID=2898442 RepID=UPI0025582EB4|nr:AAA family ATPase [Bradyrhizobium sp. 62B]